MSSIVQWTSASTQHTRQRNWGYTRQCNRRGNDAEQVVDEVAAGIGFLRQSRQDGQLCSMYSKHCQILAWSTAADIAAAHTVNAAASMTRGMHTRQWMH